VIIDLAAEIDQRALAFTPDTSGV